MSSTPWKWQPTSTRRPPRSIEKPWPQLLRWSLVTMRRPWRALQGTLLDLLPRWILDSPCRHPGLLPRASQRHLACRRSRSMMPLPEVPVVLPRAGTGRFRLRRVVLEGCLQDVVGRGRDEVPDGSCCSRQISQEAQGHPPPGLLLEDFEYSEHTSWASSMLAAAVAPLMEAVVGERFYFSWGTWGEASETPEAELGTMVTCLAGVDQVIVNRAAEETADIEGDYAGVGLCRNSMSSFAYHAVVQNVAGNINTEDTYTFCVWGCSRFIDVLRSPSTSWARAPLAGRIRFSEASQRRGPRSAWAMSGSSSSRPSSQSTGPRQGDH
mmetsp:Transcript_19254/g.62707  ORF Transcript_19254/g.62707 Transcript_19254/m.62707 type:complete len:324 (-) Transcript_19254:108-1079(-)